MNATTKKERLFGGDAAKQRAEEYAQRHGLRVVPAEQLTQEQAEAFRLDAFSQRDGIRYDYAAIL